MSAILVLKRLDYEVEVLTSSSLEGTQTEYRQRGIRVTNLLGADQLPAVGMFGKMRSWTTFSHRTWKYLDSNRQDSLLWLGSADTALAMGKRIQQRRYVLQLQELYDSNPLYRRMLKAFAQRSSCVVVPDFNRACILRSWYKLKETPVVVPNKPANHPRQRRLSIEDSCAHNIISSVSEGEKLVLYQGGIRPYSELRYVAEAVQQMGTGWRLVVMGSGNVEYLEKLRKEFPGCLHIPRVTPPKHLQVTSHAHIGIVTYSYECLNFLFCAPNKTWEFSGFGVPMICNDLPSLRSEIQNTGAGLCVNIQQTEAIVAALKSIDANHVTFQCNAHRLYDSIDIADRIRSAIERACDNPAASYGKARRSKKAA